MKYETVADIYSANEKARAELIAALNSVSTQEAAALPDGEKWTIEQIAEHLSMVDFGISRICSKLLENARKEGKQSDGTLNISADFNEKSAVIDEVKIEAPERVQPTGNVTINEALEKLKANREAFDAMRADLEKFDVSGPKFPHPYFGEITAAEWLIVAGGHEHRHTKQIERLLTQIRK
ncbi:MAG: DinB family protein [Pyrinomonadaceae bacterium]